MWIGEKRSDHWFSLAERARNFNFDGGASTRFLNPAAAGQAGLRMLYNVEVVAAKSARKAGGKSSADQSSASKTSDGVAAGDDKASKAAGAGKKSGKAAGGKGKGKGQKGSESEGGGDDAAAASAASAQGVKLEGGTTKGKPSAAGHQAASRSRTFHVVAASRYAISMLPEGGRGGGPGKRVA